MNRLRDFVRFFGILRALLVLCVVGLVIAAPFSGAPTHVMGWPLVRSVIAPTLFVIMAFVLPLDLAMTLVFMSGRQGLERRRLRVVALVEGVLFIAMLAAWAPLLLRLLRSLD